MSPTLLFKIIINKSIMSKKVILFLIACFWINQTIGQTTNQGLPKSWTSKISINPADYYLMPSFDLEKQKAIDELNDAIGGQPWQFGYEHSVNYGLTNAGTWTSLPNGDRVWLIEFESVGALTMNLIFDDYQLPKGATVYLYNRKTKELRGAYTQQNNNPDRMLGTTLVQGDNIVVEYYEPQAVQGQGRLNIGMVVHGYRSLGDYPREKAMEGLNDGGDCNLDVRCPLGTGWEDQINSVAMIIVGGTGNCTGALINNTSNDGTPYFLSANHCGTVGLGAWVFRFNWDSPVPRCAQTGTSPAPTGPYNEVNGAVLRANNAGSDFCLMELNNIPTGDIYYAGWDRSTTPATQTTGIHHPRGDLKKICRDNDPVSSATSGGAAVWKVGNWEQGVTEPASSGSPLFNQNKLIVGQLLGGNATCTGTTNNGLDDNYGKLDVSWNGTSAATRLRDWLDPGNTNVFTQNGYDPNSIGLALDAGVARIDGIPAHACGIDSFIPQISVRNYGQDTITTVNLLYNIDGATNSSYTWNGAILPNAVAIVSLPIITAGTGAHSLNVSTSLPNGAVDSNAVNDANSFAFSITLGSFPVNYGLATDCYASETSWTLRDSVTGALLFSGGPYTDYFTAADTLRDQFCLPAGCYRFAIYDDYGDGMDGTNSIFCGRFGDYWIKDLLGNDIVRMNAVNGDFGDSAVHYFCVPHVVNSQTQLKESISFKVFPNPTTDNIYVQVVLPDEELIQLSLYNAAGQLLQKISASGTKTGTYTFPLHDYSQGIYFIKFQSNEKVALKKVVKQ